ncbi:MAG: hypothetical protein Kow00128_15220 [Deltaproteobacteria bacterium]
MTDLKTALDRIETDIAELKRQYDLFFQGTRRTEPAEERRILEWMVRRMGQRKIPNTSDQFRFTTLQGRYHSLANLWSRMVRDLEEGRLHRDATGAVTRPGLTPDDPVDRDHLETVVEQIRSARSECGMQTGPEEAERLRRTLLERARQFARKSGAGKVQFRVSVEDGKPKIRAGKA